MENKKIPEPEMLEFARQVPFDPTALSYVSFGALHPYEFTGWKEETMSWKENCYIHAGLSFMVVTADIIGPDAVKMLSDISVNSFKNFPVGSAKHLIMCNQKGNIMSHGMAVRAGEEVVRTYDLAPYIQYVAETGKYDVEVRDVTNERFVYQLAGQKSLEIVENAAKQDIHDLKFMRFMKITIAGCEVDVLRMGMGGTISYEIQGMLEDAHDVYNAIIAAGEPYDIHKLGSLTYICNHTENGFPQSCAHFPLAWVEDEGFVAWGSENLPIWSNHIFAEPKGTFSSEIKDLFVNPIELDWGHLVKFDHDFIGREALEKIAANPKRKVVTLRWDAEDVVDIFRSYLQPGEPYRQLVFPLDFQAPGPMTNDHWAEKVTKDGKTIGSSRWYVYTIYSHDVISLGFIDIDQAELGNEVSLFWGEMDGRQKEIRATVSRFPYLDLPSNQEYDLESIPRYQEK